MAGTFDYFLNSFSFQEMEFDLVGRYLGIVPPMITKGIYADAHDMAEAATARVMKTAGTRSYIKQYLASHGLSKVLFESRFWPRYIRGDATMCLLMQR